MNHVVAYKLLTSELAAYRSLGFDALRHLVGEITSSRKHGDDGIEYEVSIRVRWRDCEEGDIRVIGFVGETAWNNPLDSLDDTFIVAASRVLGT